MRHASRGFTLIELLVVVAIIGMLASIILASLDSARKKGRDARRAADLNQVRNALALYASDNNGNYPSTGLAWYSSEAGDVVGNNGGNYIPGLAPNYIASLPRSPGGTSLCGGWKNAYLYRSDGTNYKMLAHCGPEGTWTSSYGLYDPLRPTWAWMICSGPPACASW